MVARGSARRDRWRPRFEKPQLDYGNNQVSPFFFRRKGVLAEFTSNRALP
jgi:hypothetical protein